MQTAITTTPKWILRINFDCRIRMLLHRQGTIFKKPKISGNFRSPLMIHHFEILKSEIKYVILSVTPKTFVYKLENNSFIREIYTLKRWCSSHATASGTKKINKWINWASFTWKISSIPSLDRNISIKKKFIFQNNFALEISSGSSPRIFGRVGPPERGCE